MGTQKGSLGFRQYHLQFWLSVGSGGIGPGNLMNEKLIQAVVVAALSILSALGYSINTSNTQVASDTKQILEKIDGLSKVAIENRGYILDHEKRITILEKEVLPPVTRVPVSTN